MWGNDVSEKRTVSGDGLQDAAAKRKRGESINRLPRNQSWGEKKRQRWERDQIKIEDRKDKVNREGNSSGTEGRHHGKEE